MAALTHAGVGLAAKRIAPNVPVWILVVSAYAIDIIFGVFWALGIEHTPDSGVATASPYSHGLFMALIWSLLAGLIARRISRSDRTGTIIGLMVFSHWIVDFISHPMTAVFPEDTPLPLFFDGSPTVGLGVWSTQLGVSIGEYGSLVLGLVIYLLTLRKLRRDRQTAEQTNALNRGQA